MTGEKFPCKLQLSSTGTMLCPLRPSAPMAPTPQIYSMPVLASIFCGFPGRPAVTLSRWKPTHALLQQSPWTIPTFLRFRDCKSRVERFVSSKNCPDRTLVVVWTRATPFFNAAADAPEELRTAYERAQFYRLEPAHITIIDNTRGLGFKQTLDFPSSGRA
jgi:hypothetical protein